MGEKMQLHELTQSMRQKDMKFVNCLDKIHTTVPLEGSQEDRMLQACELKPNPSNENYPHDAMHVYAHNAHCDEWNAYELKLLPAKEFTNIARDSKKDDSTELANITMPTNSCETGNLKKVLTVKINARVMITTNIDVNDGLTNGAMGTVTNVVIDEKTGKMSTILVSFDSKYVGQEAMHTSVYNSTNQNAVLLCKAVLTLSKLDAYFFICDVSRGLCYNPLYALILHSKFAHHQVPFSLGVSQNKRTSALHSNKLKLLLHKTQT